MKAFLFAALIVLCAVSLRAQDAKVVELSVSDTAEVKSAYEQYQAAQKHWTEVQDKIKRTYKGFDSGFEFSSDFRFIVPKAAEKPCYYWNYMTPAYYTWPSCSTCTTTLTPNITIGSWTAQ